MDLSIELLMFVLSINVSAFDTEVACKGNPGNLPLLSPLWHEGFEMLLVVLSAGFKHLVKGIGVWVWLPMRGSS